MGDVGRFLFGGGESEQTSRPVSGATLDPEVQRVRQPFSQYLASLLGGGGGQPIQPRFEGMLEGITRQFDPELFGAAGETVGEQLETGFRGDVEPYLASAENLFNRLVGRQGAELTEQFGRLGQRYGSDILEAQGEMRAGAIERFMPQILQAMLQVGEGAAGRRAAAVPTAATMAFEPARFVQNYEQMLMNALLGFSTGFPPIGEEVSGKASEFGGVLPAIAAIMGAMGSGGGAPQEDLRFPGYGG